MTVTLCLSCSLGLLNRRPRAHSAACWISLLHLISIFSGSQTPSGFPRAPSVGCGFPYHSQLQLSGTLLATPQLIRAQRPLRPDVAFSTTSRLQLSGAFWPELRCHWNVSLPSGASPWNGIFGRVKRSKHNRKTD